MKYSEHQYIWSVLAVNRRFVRKRPKIARDKSAPDRRSSGLQSLDGALTNKPDTNPNPKIFTEAHFQTPRTMAQKGKYVIVDILGTGVGLMKVHSAKYWPYYPQMNVNVPQRNVNLSLAICGSLAINRRITAIIIKYRFAPHCTSDVIQKILWRQKVDMDQKCCNWH